MARTKYGASSADYVVDPSTGLPVPNTSYDVYDAETGGTHITSLLNEAGSAATQVTTDAAGGYRFSGPDGYDGPLWVEGMVNGVPKRYLVLPVTNTDRIGQLEDDLATANTSWQAVADGAAADATNKSQAAQSGAEAYADGLMADHLDTVDNPNPHPEYVQMLPAGTTARIWGASFFPTAGQGAQDGDYLFYEG